MTRLAEQLRFSGLTGAGGLTVTRDELSGLTPREPVAQGGGLALCLRDPTRFVKAICALDGAVDRVLLLSSALDPGTAAELVARAGCAAVITDRDDLGASAPAVAFEKAVGPGQVGAERATQWLLTTSGTTGIPKIVPHTIASLTRSVFRFPQGDFPTWGLLYDPTRFAGLQVTLQALLGGGRLVAVDTHAPISDQIAELAVHGCTHLSATPTLWRRILMVPAHRDLPLRQVTLGGEIADQPTIDALRASFPAARVTHIYASTEAGVGFSVNDGRAGFPAAYLQAAPGGVRLKLRDGILWLRPPVPTPPGPGIEVDEDGYVRSGDMIEERGDRLIFLGRENGLINVGGVKFYPETVENVVKGVPGVALVQVSAKKNPITGTLVVADILADEGADPAVVKSAILEACRAELVREAVPAIIRFVDGLETNAAGKLVRRQGTPR